MKGSISKMKKTLSLFLSLVIVLSGLVFPINSYASDVFKSMDQNAVHFENPVYSGEEVSSSINSYITEPSKSEKYNNHTYYAKGKELYTTIKKGIENRQATITVYYLSSQSITTSAYVLNDLIQDFFMSATDDEISSTCTDGDYARWVVSGGSIDLYKSTVDKETKNKYYYKLVLTYEYYDTAAQEKQVTTAVNKIVDSIDTSKLSDYEIIKKIHDTICNNATYSYEAAENPYKHTYAFTAYGALVKGKCVCQGYSVAFYRICKELGYKVRFVSSDPVEGCHAWNMVQLDNKYYFVDCTWDDQIRDEKDDADVQKIFNNNSYYYFLVNYDTLRSQDYTRYENPTYAHTLYDELYENKYFHTNYSDRLSQTDYDLENTNVISRCTVTLSSKTYAYANKALTPKPVLKSADGKTLKENVDYKLSYSANKNTGIAKVNVTGLGQYAGTSTRTFTIIPKKMTSLSLASSSRTSSSLKLKWTKDSSGITGYVLEKYDTKAKAYKAVKTITSASTTSYKVTSLSPNTTYKFRIRAYKDISSKRYYGAYSAVYTNSTIPKKPTVSKLTTKSKSITVSWKKVTCSGYQIQYSTKSSMKGAKTVNVSSKSKSKKIAKLKKGKKYYVRIRAYKSYKNPSTNKTTKYYTAWSGKKSIKCK